jgi:hypothetical protein
MTGDRRDREPATDSPGTGSWVSDLRDLERRDDSFSGSPRLRDLAARKTGTPDRARNHDSTPPEETPQTPDRDSSRTSPATGSSLVTAIRHVSDFEEVTPVGSADERRYGRVVDARVTLDGRTYDLDLRLFRRPDQSGFDEALADQIDRWAAASDRSGVVPVLDGAGDPRPWSCTASITRSLADRSRLSPDAAVDEATALARTLDRLHDSGIVHAGIDPGHVVYPAGSDRPQFDNVGLPDVYRRYTDPATILDPRYAPPEYFDDRYGVIDRTTDVYALGAVLYRLFTGRAPYRGSPAEIRESVLTDPFPRPSAVADVPEAVDGVIRRATATDKFDRYPSATALAEAVRGLRAHLDG